MPYLPLFLPITLLAVSTPAVLAGAVFALLAKKETNRFKYFRHMTIVCSTSYILVALAFWGLDSYVGNPLYFELTTLISLTSILAMLLLIKRKSRKFNFKPPSLSLVPYTLPVIIISIIALNTPLQGWDVTTFWGAVGAQIVEHSQNPSSQSFIFNHRHPLTIPHLIAWLGWLTSSTGTFIGPSIIWLFWGLSVMAIVGSFALENIKNKWLAATLFLTIITTPLLENHIIGWGYSELPLTLIIIASCAVLADRDTNYPLKEIAVALFLGAMTITLRNTGPYYFLLLAVVALISSLIECWRSHADQNLNENKRQLLNNTKVTLASVPLLIASIFFITYFPTFMSDTVSIGGRKILFVAPNLDDIAAIYAQAFFSSSTFGLNLLIALICLSLAWNNHRQFTPSMIVFSYTALFIHSLQLASLFTDHGLVHALPGRDTGFSRFYLPIAVVQGTLMVQISAALGSSR